MAIANRLWAEINIAPDFPTSQEYLATDPSTPFLAITASSHGTRSCCWRSSWWDNASRNWIRIITHLGRLNWAGMKQPCALAENCDPLLRQ